MLNEETLRKRTRKLMFDNMIHGHSKVFDVDYAFTQPSPERYPFQYFWDTCIHAIILVSIGEVEHARKHLRSLFFVQQEDGFIGNIIYWKKIFPARTTDFFQMKASTILQLRSPHMSNIVQPPLIAQSVMRVYEETNDKSFLQEVMPGLKKYYGWLQKNRDFDGDHLLSIISPFESGMDWKATFDPVLGFHGKANKKLFRKVVTVDFKNFWHNYNLEKIAQAGYFRVKDAGFNSIYARNLQIMAELCRILEDKDEENFRNLAKKVTKSIVDVMYDAENQAFYDTAGPENKKLKILTPTIFYPVLMDVIPDKIDEAVMNRHFYKSEEFDTTYPIPSLAKNEPAFYPGASIYIWRGPTWILNNWFMHKYLLRNNHKEEAKTLMRSMLELIDKSGFREYYNPFTGEGYGAKDFTWGGLVLDMMHNEQYEDMNWEEDTREGKKKKNENHSGDNYKIPEKE